MDFCLRQSFAAEIEGGLTLEEEEGKGRGLSLCGFGEAEQIVSWKRALCDFLRGHVRCLIGLG